MRKILLLSIFLYACATPAAPNESTDAALEPYLTATPAATSTPNVLVILETPVPTNTPQIYIVESGDTISEIAEKFKIPQADLIAANPDVNPNSLAIGATIIIPNPSAALAAASTPTPLPVPITQAACHPTADSGNWCFALVHNNTGVLIENVSAQITLLDKDNNALASQVAFTPLYVIAPNSAQPVYVFFPNTPAGVTPQVQLLSAMQSSSARYLAATLNNAIAKIEWSGRSAQVNGQIFLPTESTAATQVWVAAIAYDANGTVVGVRRWEGRALQPGSSLNFDFSVSSVGGEIEAVEFAVQAR